MFISRQGAQQAVGAQQTAQQGQMQAAQAKLMQAQQQLEKAIADAQSANEASGVSADTKQQVKEQIRSAFDAVREAAQEARAGQTTESQAGDFNDLIPQRAVDIVSIMGVTLVCCVVGFPLARAFARWIDRRGVTPPVNREVVARLEGIEQAVESVAVEVERISEGQRFTTRMLSERTHEPAGNFAPPERVPVDLAGNAPVNARRG